MQGTKYITQLTPVPDKIELTANFTSIEDYNGIDAYYVGWTQVPTFMNVYDMRYTETVFASVPVTTATRAAFTWGSNYSNSPVTRWSTYTMQKSNSLDEYTSCYYRLVNKLNCGNINTQAPVIDVGFIGNVTLPNNPSYGITPLSSIEMRARQFGGGDDTDAVLEDLHGTTEQSFDVVFDLPWYGINSKRFVVKYKMSDLAPGYYEIDMTEDDVRLFGYVFISGVWLQGSRAFYESWETPVSMDGYPELYPIIKNDNYLIGANFAPYNTPLILRWDTNSYPRITNGGLYIEGERGKVLGSYEGLDIKNNGDSSSQLWYYYDWVEKNGTCICRNTTSAGTDRIIHIFPYIPVSDIDTFVKMFPRLEGKGAPIYDSSFEPTDEWSDNPEELAPWQSDITENDYDGTIPEEPTQNDPEQEAGVIQPSDRFDEGTIPINTSLPSGVSGNFITQYALTSAEINGIGSTLWSILSNNNLNTNPSFINMVKNFFTLSSEDELNETFHFTNANIIDYFLNLRWYPFSIGQVAGFTNYTGPLKVGSGACPLAQSSRILSKSIGIIQAGYCDVPAAVDFRDLEPITSMTLYVPFCGTIELQPSLVVGSRVSLTYFVDFNTGSCTAYVYISTKKKDREATYPIATLNGTLGFDILLTGNNAQVVSARALTANNLSNLQIAQSLMGSVASSLAGLSLGGGSKTPSTIGEVGAPGSKGNSNTLSLGGGVGQALLNAAFERAKQVVQQPILNGISPMSAGNFTSMSALGYLKPFIQKKYHTEYNNGVGYGSVGYLADKPYKIGELQDNTFFTCINPKLKGIPATSSELSQINAALTNGCYK